MQPENMFPKLWQPINRESYSVAGKMFSEPVTTQKQRILQCSRKSFFRTRHSPGTENLTVQPENMFPKRWQPINREPHLNRVPNSLYLLCGDLEPSWKRLEPRLRSDNKCETNWNTAGPEFEQGSTFLAYTVLKFGTFWTCLEPGLNRVPNPSRVWHWTANVTQFGNRLEPPFNRVPNSLTMLC